MSLTKIAKQLKETFEGFEGSDLRDVLEEYRERYGDAESIRIGDIDYIVINEEYRSDEYSDVPESTSPLFFNSINTRYAIIDARTSSTLIDEVYSRVTYMQREYKTRVPDSKEVVTSLQGLLGEGVTVTNDVRFRDESESGNKANIFQCRLIMDTGVSASPDTYSFMLKNGEIKEIADSAMRQIKRTGDIKLLQDREELEQNSHNIQQAVFDKYINSDIDIQTISVKSIFEISMSFLNIQLPVNEQGDEGVFNSSYLAGSENEFESLNANIHVCDSCRHDIVDVLDPSKIYRIHVNTDAINEELTTEHKTVYATGCEDCLVECPVCHKWHFNYEKFAGTGVYDRITLAPGRGFIRSLRFTGSEPAVNYCTCRECTEWVYDEKSGSETEHKVIPVDKMVFLNYANERIAGYEDFKKFYERRRGRKKLTALQERDAARDSLKEFKKKIAEQFEMSDEDIIVSSVDRCMRCETCGGEYYRTSGADLGYTSFRCDVCRELISEKRRMITRIDGIVFMRRSAGRSNIVSKYVVTKLGNLKKLSSARIEETAPAEEPEEAAQEIQ